MQAQQRRTHTRGADPGEGLEPGAKSPFLWGKHLPLPFLLRSQPQTEAGFHQHLLWGANGLSGHPYRAQGRGSLHRCGSSSHRGSPRRVFASKDEGVPIATQMAPHLVFPGLHTSALPQRGHSSSIASNKQSRMPLSLASQERVPVVEDVDPRKPSQAKLLQAGTAGLPVMAVVWFGG